LTAAGPVAGIWGFTASPFAEDGIDTERLAAAAQLQIDGGVDLLVACGLIAQLEQLLPEEHRESVETVITAAAGRVPVVAAIMTGPGAAAAAATAAELGAGGLLVVPVTADPDAALAALREIAAAAPGVVQILYHRPPLRLSPEHLRRLAAVPELGWVKDGHRDARLFRQLHDAVPQLRWVSAWEDVSPAFWAMGCEAFAPASTTYAPAYARAWLALLRAGDLAGARALLTAHANPMIDLRLSRPNIDVSVVHEAMRAAAVPVGRARPPAIELTDDERRRVRALVEDLAGVLGHAGSTLSQARSVIG
jgi:dihydrodipicolinate synthase/N-acetylneuraminate lyase